MATTPKNYSLLSEIRESSEAWLRDRVAQAEATPGREAEAVAIRNELARRVLAGLSARDVFDREVAEAEAMLADMAALLARKRKRFAATNGKDWGLTGDMQHATACLLRAAASLA